MCSQKSNKIIRTHNRQQTELQRTLWKTWEKLKGSWDKISRVGGSNWCLSILMLYKTIIIPQLMYASPIWFEQNKTIGVKIQQHFIRSVFRRSHTPNSSSCEVLLGLPPLDFYNDRIEIKLFIKDAMERRYRENNSPECQTDV